MTDNTQPEALIDLIDAYAETRHRCGRIHNPKTEAARKAVIEALSGVQALSAAPAGWKLVPEDATEEMVRATDKVNFANADTDGTMHNVWNVMLAATPTPPAEHQAAPKTAPGVGNSGFGHQTAADFLSGKTVSDEAVRKFVAASRWAHDERAALSATLLAMHGVLTSREAEIALLKKALLEAEAAPQQEAQEPAPSAAVFGLRLVPVEPTDQMVQAAHHIDLSYMPGQEGADRAAIYRAMIAAAPQPAVQQWNDLIGKETHADADGLLVWRDEVDFAIPTPPAEQQAASSAVLKAIHEANMQLVRTGDDAFMLVPYKVATVEQQAAPKAAPGDAIDEAMRERDDAEDFIDALLDEVLGHERPEWSNLYGRADALNDVQERMTSLHKPAVDKAWGQFQSAMAAPQPAPAPLSDAQIAEMMRDTWGCASIAPRHALEFARAIETEVRKQDDALIRQMHDALCECAEDSQEQLDRMEAAKLRQYKPQAVAFQEAIIDAAKRAITAARARLSERRNAS